MKPAGSGSKHLCFFVVTQGQSALAIYKFQTRAISDLGWEIHKSRQAFQCVCVCVVWCGGCLPPGADCVLVASGGDGKTSVSLMLLVVHSSYHHDPPMGQSGATSTTGFRRCVDSRHDRRDGPPGRGRRMKDETSPVTY